ncbi:hypothetical protein [Promicromonospora sp. NPDC059942]|uniref:hypothetical protein n=1 Tax=Promicromonospora sp. NPDC059942 TaxID=3347009 RepID=UPI00364ED6C2
MPPQPRPLPADAPTPTGHFAEVSPGPVGRVVDALHALALGAATGLLLAVLAHVVVGLLVESGAVAAPAPLDEALTQGFARDLVVLLVAIVAALALSTARTFAHARAVRDASETGADGRALPVPEYQGQVASGETANGRPFVRWLFLAVPVLVVGAFLGVFCLVEWIGDPDVDGLGGATVLAVGLTAGSVAAMLLVRWWRGRLADVHLATRHAPVTFGADPGIEPVELPAVYRWAGRLASVVGVVTVVVLQAVWLAVAAWGALSGRGLAIGGRFVLLPGGSERAANVDAVVGSPVSVAVTVLVALALGLAALRLVANDLRYVLARRALVARLDAPLPDGQRPQPELTGLVLTFDTPVRRATTTVAAVGSLAVALTTTLQPFWDLGPAPRAAAVVVDGATAGRRRRLRNRMLAAWPAATRPQAQPIRG